MYYNFLFSKKAVIINTPFIFLDAECYTFTKEQYMWLFLALSCSTVYKSSQTLIQGGIYFLLPFLCRSTMQLNEMQMQARLWLDEFPSKNPIQNESFYARYALFIFKLSKFYEYLFLWRSPLSNSNSFASNYHQTGYSYMIDIS